MEHPKEYYYKFNRFILSVSGLWPYQSEWSAHLTRAVITVFMLSSAFFQISSMFTSKVTLDFIVDGMPSLLLTLGSLSNLYSRIIHIDKFRELFERMWQDWALQKTHHEIKIMHEHAEISRLFTFYYISKRNINPRFVYGRKGQALLSIHRDFMIYMNVVGYNIWIFIPEILDIISPMNESRPRRQPFNAEFFVDEEQYFYFFRFHICLVIIIIPIVYVASSTLFLTLTQHTCGMCELLGHRAERLFCVVKDEARYDLIQMSQITCGNISVFVQQHYNIIQFVEIIETCHTIPFLIDLISLMILMSLTLIQVFQIITISGMERAIRSIGVFCSVLCYVFISSYMGQRITDMSSSLCGKIFNSMWYNAVVSEQKTLLIIMMRRYQPLILTACKFYVMSLQNFGMIINIYISKILQTTISYCMFIRQI
ncbi:OR4 protein, partial [Acromyrmex charruanus]